MNRDLLEKPFDQNQIKQREGSFGKMLDYIEGHAVIQRLNDAFDGEWSFTMTKHEIMSETDEVIVIGQLNAGGIVKSQFGSSRITRAKESGEIVSLADNLKAAATDALKKAATLLGIGLHLYRGASAGAPNRAGDRQNERYPRNGGNGGNGSGYNRKNGNGNGGGRLSSKQYRYMLKLIEERGSNKADLDRQCQEMFGSMAQYLSKADASVVIEQLLAG
jgi:hypothetical protein